MVARSFSASLLVAAGSVAAGVVVGAPAENAVIRGRAAQVEEEASSSHFSLPLRRKEGKEMSRLQSRAASSSSSSDSLPLVAGVKTDWHVIMEVGTPAQELDMILDLGSSYCLVESDLKPPAMQTTKYPIYHPNKSTTAKKWEGVDWNIKFTNLHESGPNYNETVRLGNITLTDFPVQVVAVEDVGSPVESWSGILGLSNMVTSFAPPHTVPNFIGAVFKKVEKSLFTLWFDWTTQAGSIEFGKIDKEKYTGEIAYTPVYNTGNNKWWGVNISGFGAMDPKTHQLIHANMEPFQAILDTGASRSILTNNSLQGYYGGIPGAIWDAGGGTWDYPCLINESLPLLVLFIGDQRVVVERHSYGYAETMGTVDKVHYCTTHLWGDWTANTKVIGGDILAGLYTVYDYENQQIGFANSSVTALHDKDFFVPKTWPDACSYVKANLTVTPSIIGCTAEHFDGSCSKIAVTAPGCTVLNAKTNLASMQPPKDSNLICTMHSDDECTSPIAGAIGLTYPGTESLSQTPRSIMCANAGITPSLAKGGVIIPCGDQKVDGEHVCRVQGVEPFVCETMFRPSENFQWIMHDVHNWNYGPRTGTCFFFEDSNCKKTVSGLMGVDMCNSDVGHENYQVDFSSYVGSVMCF